VNPTHQELSREFSVKPTLCDFSRNALGVESSYVRAMLTHWPGFEFRYPQSSRPRTV
jgi:hypothetical protein